MKSLLITIFVFISFSFVSGTSLKELKKEVDELQAITESVVEASGPIYKLVKLNCDVSGEKEFVHATVPTWYDISGYCNQLYRDIFNTGDTEADDIGEENE